MTEEGGIRPRGVNMRFEFAGGGENHAIKASQSHIKPPQYTR